MKTIDDFQMVDGIAVLKGVAYAEESEVVNDYLKKYNNVRYASVLSADGRNFELRNGRLVVSSEKTFTNPYFSQEKRMDEFLYMNSSDIRPLNEISNTANQDDTELIITKLENKVSSYQKLLVEIIELINSYDDTFIKSIRKV